jgi:hypothetical protein
MSGASPKAGPVTDPDRDPRAVAKDSAVPG